MTRILLALAVLTLFCCPVNAETCVTTFPKANFDFSQKPLKENHYWFYRQGEENVPDPHSKNALLRVTADGLSSDGDWTLDYRHTGGVHTYGVGALYLVAVALFNQQSSQVPAALPLGPCMNLSGDEVIVKANKSSDISTEKTKMFFFFQNCIPVVSTCAPNGAGVSFTVGYILKNTVSPLKLTARPEDWVCFGANDVSAYPSKNKGITGGYGCAKDKDEFTNVLEHVSGNVGFLKFIPHFDIPHKNSPKYPCPSSIVFKEITIQRPQKRRSQAPGGSPGN